MGTLLTTFRLVAKDIIWFLARKLFLDLNYELITKGEIHLNAEML